MTAYWFISFTSLADGKRKFGNCCLDSEANEGERAIFPFRDSLNQIEEGYGLDHGTTTIINYKEIEKDEYDAYIFSLSR